MRKLLRTAITAILLSVCFAAVDSTHAQLNEKKVERDATGIYKGKKSGGTYTFDLTTDNDPPVTTPLPTNAGKMKMPVKSKKPTTTLNDSEIVGGTALFTGDEEKSKVSRSGKKIGYVADEGFCYTEENVQGVNPWMNGTFRGPFKDRGKKWKSKARSGGVAGTQFYYEVGEGMVTNAKH